MQRLPFHRPCGRGETFNFVQREEVDSLSCQELEIVHVNAHQNRALFRQRRLNQRAQVFDFLQLVAHGDVFFLNCDSRHHRVAVHHIAHRGNGRSHPVVHVERRLLERV